MWEHWTLSLCACAVSLASSFFLQVFLPPISLGGRPTFPTQGAVTRSGGCCITNIASPLFVYFLPNPTRPTAQRGWRKHRRKTVFTSGWFFALFLAAEENKTFLHQRGKSLLPDFINDRASSRPCLKCPQQSLATFKIFKISHKP